MSKPLFGRRPIWAAGALLLAIALCLIAAPTAGQGQEVHRNLCLRYQILDWEPTPPQGALLDHQINIFSYSRGNQTSPVEGVVPLAQGQWSAWFALDSFLPGADVQYLNFSPKAPEVKRVKVELEFAFGPEPEGKPVAKSLVVEADGGFQVSLPGNEVPEKDYLRLLRTVAEEAQGRREYAEQIGPKPEERPKRFILSTDMRGMELPVLESEMTALRALGLNTLCLGGNTIPQWGELAKKCGFDRTTFRIYYTPYFEYPPSDPKVREDFFSKFAQGMAGTGYSPSDLALFAIADEPGWYYPSALEAFRNGFQAGDERWMPLPKEKILADFHDYLRSQGLKPQDLGCDSWEQVEIVSEPKPDDSRSRRLYYQSVKFANHSCSLSYADATRAVEKAFGPQTYAWHNSNHRNLIIAHAGWRTDLENRIIASPEWFDFARSRGANMLWAGPWISDGNETTQNWSFHIDLLRSAARANNLPLGAYLIPGWIIPEDRPEILQLQICDLVGHGVKAIDYWTYGPAYIYDGWSRDRYTFEPMAESHKMMGRVEDLLYPGQKRKAEVALLYPISAQIWNLNEGIWEYNVGFLAELQMEYLALTHDHYPVDFLCEEDVAAGGLEGYKALYITAPNIAVSAQQKIREWVAKGGFLFATAGAGQKNEYDEDVHILDDVLGLTSQTVERTAEGKYGQREGIPRLPTLGSVSLAKSGLYPRRSFVAIGYRSAVQVSAGAEVLGKFRDGSPGVVLNSFGKGKSLFFATLPGVAYCRSARPKPNQYTTGYRARERELITVAAKAAGVVRPVEVDYPLLETSLLESEKGFVVSLINFSAQPIENAEVLVRGVGKVSSVKSAARGELAYRREGNSIRFSLPVGYSDFVAIYR